MRKIVNLKNKYIFFALVLVIYINFSCALESNKGELIIDITNESYQQINEIYEGEKFLISTYLINSSGIPVYQVGVDIEFNNEIYHISLNSTNPEIILEAPQVSEDKIFSIRAVKSMEIYNTTLFTVLNYPQLVVLPDDYTIEANKQFSILVKDEMGNPIEGVTVGIQSFTGKEYIAITNDNGRAWLLAPDGHREISLIAQKEGFMYSKPVILGVNTNPGFFEIIVNNPFTPIFIAIVILVFSIFFVSLRQKKHIEKKSLEIRKKEFSKENEYHQLDNDHSSFYNPIKSLKQNELNDNPSIKQKQESKIEEIRINRPSIDKKILSVENNIKSDEETNNKKNSNWFKGTNNIRYEIDKITGIIDEDGKDKWFEGKYDIRKKIDEKISKKDREKNKI
jgi:hypothetical protein